MTSVSASARPAESLLVYTRLMKAWALRLISAQIPVIAWKCKCGSGGAAARAVIL